jgi:hypothetical protein
VRHVAIAVLAVAAFGTPASAQIGSGAPSCENEYKQFWSTTGLTASKELSGAQLAQLSRYALRGYDGCTAGDERFSKGEYFKRLGTIQPGKADEFFKDLEKSFPAKK